MVIPFQAVQMAYVWQHHGWIARLATETVLIVGWGLVTFTGVASAIRDWFTVHKDESESGVVVVDDHQRR
jgi:heme A synthase